MTNEQLQNATILDDHIKRVSNILTDIKDNNAVLKINSTLTKSLIFSNNNNTDNTNYNNLNEHIYYLMIGILEDYQKQLIEMYENI